VEIGIGVRDASHTMFSTAKLKSHEFGYAQFAARGSDQPGGGNVRIM
jgi:hypothetical protein